MMQTSPAVPPPPVLVGRDRELTLLRQQLPAIQGSHRNLVLVAGEAGVGKTALIAAISAEAAAAGYLVLRGDCYDLTTTPPYGPWAEIIARMPDDDQHPPVPTQLRGGLGTAGIASQDDLFDLTVRFLCEVARSQPLVMVLEDLHWTDVASLDFLRYLSRSMLDAPMLVIVTYRDEELTREHPLSILVPTLVREGRVERVHLQGLEHEGVRALVRDRYLLAPADEDRLTTNLFTLAEGNPFYTKEFLYSLTEQRVLVPIAGGWGVGDLTHLSVPNVIHQVIGGRLDRLSAETRAVLDTAAVVGFDVPLEMLDQLCQDGVTTPAGAEDLDRALQEATQHHILMADANNRSAHFNHALVRQSLYEALAPMQRRALHRRVGELLAGRSSSNPTTVAKHFFEAGDPRAFDWCVQAAEQARRLFAPDAVLAECTRAIAAADGLHTTIDARIYRLRGWAWESVGDFERALQDLEQALSNARQAVDPHAQWESLLDLAGLWASRDYQKTGYYCRQSVALARTMDDPAALAHSLNRLGNWHVNAEQPADAIPHHDEALRIFAAIGDTSGLASTHDLVGMTHILSGNATQAMYHYGRAVPLLRELDDRHTLSSALINAAMFTRGIWTSSALGIEEMPSSIGMDEERAADESIRLAREVGWRAGEAFALSHAGLAEARRGKLRVGLQQMSDALTMSASIQHHQWLTKCYTDTGSIFLDLLVLDHATDYLSQGLSHATATGSTIFLPGTTGLLATTHIKTGNIAAAELLLDGQIDMGRGPRTISDGCCWYAYALLLLHQQQPNQALAVVERVIARMATGPSATPPEWLRIRAEALLACGKPDDAATSLTEAYAIAVARTLPLRQWRVSASLHHLHLLQGQADEARAARDAGLTLIDQLANQLDDVDVRDTFVTQARAQFDGLQPAETHDDPTGAPTAGLTPRELEILSYIVQGRTDREIADALSVSHRTVGNHVSNMLSKLQVPSRTAAAIFAIRAGLIPD